MTDWLSGVLFAVHRWRSARLACWRRSAAYARLAIQHPEVSFAARAGTIGVFMMLTSAVAAHVIARAAALSGAPLWNGTVIDERPVETADSEERRG